MTIIVAITRDRAIGRNGDMIYHISGDLRRFKALTMGHPILMGRKTFESFPKGPLPGRRNIVLTRSEDYHPDGAEIVHSMEEALSLADDMYVIGGAQIYSQALPMADKLEITEIDAVAPDADTYFPEIGDEWQAVEIGQWQYDERNHVNYRYVTLTRCAREQRNESRE